MRSNSSESSLRWAGMEERPLSEPTAMATGPRPVAASASPARRASRTAWSTVQSKTRAAASGLSSSRGSGTTATTTEPPWRSTARTAAVTAPWACRSSSGSQSGDDAAGHVQPPSEPTGGHPPGLSVPIDGVASISSATTSRSSSFSGRSGKALETAVGSRRVRMSEYVYPGLVSVRPVRATSFSTVAGLIPIPARSASRSSRRWSSSGRVNRSMMRARRRIAGSRALNRLVQMKTKILPPKRLRSSTFWISVLTATLSSW